MASKSNILNKHKIEHKFKSFNETYKYCAFGLALGMIYPNKRKLRLRYIVFGSVLLINGPEIFWFFHYTFKTLFSLDMLNLTRNVTMGVLVVLFVFKTVYVNMKNDIFEDLLNKITKDLLRGNELDEDCQDLYIKYVRKGKIGQTIWLIIPILLSAVFPIYAASLTIYNAIKSDDGKRYMVHEHDLKYIEDKQYSSPYYEIIFAYNMLQCSILPLSFIGFDGSFCIVTTHLRLRLKLVSQQIQKSFLKARDRFELRTRLGEAVKSHQETLLFYDQIQDIYGPWLFMVFCLNTFMISLNLYQVYITKRVDPVYITFGFSAVLHMFTPCYYATKLIEAGEEFSGDAYDASWEVWADPVTTKALTFIIAKSQRRLILTGCGLCLFNMELFVSIMRTSYSLFTLIIRT